MNIKYVMFENEVIQFACALPFYLPSADYKLQDTFYCLRISSSSSISDVVKTVCLNAKSNGKQ